MSGDMEIDIHGNTGDRHFRGFSTFLTSNIFSLYIGRFGESSLYRIVKWIKSCEKITKSSLFLDIGCGNGILLVKLVCLP